MARNFCLEFRLPPHRHPGDQEIPLSIQDLTLPFATCMTAKSDLKELVSSLRKCVNDRGLDADAVREATAKLERIGYAYDASRFPPLPNDLQWDGPDLHAPSSLAEALLWKMGKWKVYKSFTSYYSNPSSLPTTSDVVFYAFAQHLRDRSLPIYDQHALRALWAIDAGLTDDQASTCRGLLAKRNGDWKTIASGPSSPKGYRIYASRISELCAADLRHDDFDKLLMPLGQALKTVTENVKDFVELAGCAG